jgi:hypothetical protein
MTKEKRKQERRGKGRRISKNTAWKGKEKRKGDRRKQVKGGILTTIGFVLSPLSWWNDLLVNIPLAYIFAIPFGMISKVLFIPMMILGYWITNVVGFMMMHHGLKDLTLKETKKRTQKELVKELIMSSIYTLTVVLFVLMGWIKFPMEYFA